MIQGELISLRRLLHRSQLINTLLIVGLTGVALMLVGTLSIVRHANQNLSLLGRTLAYNVEAAIVFNDKEAIIESLNYLDKTEELAQVEVYNAQGELLAQWRHEGQGVAAYVERMLANTLLKQPFEQPVLNNGSPVGHLSLSIRGASLLNLLVGSFVMFLCCLIVSLLVIYASARSLRNKIVVPMAKLSSFARNIARERNFKQQMPAFELKELNNLAEDFNALLHEVQIWRGHMLEENAYLSKKARHDALTGLPNRSQFEPALLKAIMQARKTNTSCALLFLDCNDFKNINDTLGHAVGDAVLLAVAERLSRHLRKNDLVARLGGDEFAVLLSPVYQPQDALFVADKMLDSVVEPLTLPNLDRPLAVSISIGIALYPMHADNANDLVRAADAAMYHAKRSKISKYMDMGFSDSVSIER